MGRDRSKHAGQRPYFKHSVAQLETLFERGDADLDFLRTLDRELAARATFQAVALRAQVAEAIDRLDVGTATQRHGPSKQPRRASLRSRPVETKRASDRVTESSSRPPPSRDPTLATPAPKGVNEPGAILAAWTALEALSPQTYRRPEDIAAGDRNCVANLAGDRLPWETGERSRKNRRLYYHVILGAIPLSQAAQRLIATFGEDEESGLRIKEKASIAAVLVDRNGMLVEEDAVSVASFAWALPLALQRKLDGLGRWPEIEPAIVERLDALLRRQDEEGRPLPLDRAAIDMAHGWLVQEFGLAEDLVEPPSFAVRIHQHYKAKDHPGAALLNSFFLGDLARAAALVKQGRAPAGLRRYLGLDRPQQTVDLLADDAALEKAVAPAMMPAVRWPSPGGHALVMLQQAAINLARSELAGREGMIAINGPPGTGKTTLLRDIVAASVLDRALALAAFDDPETAFTRSGERIAAGEKASFSLYSLAPSLKGHEIVVASSNNKAVENVSRELPAASAVGRSSEELSYFRSVSDALQGSQAAAAREEGESAVAPEAIDTWGMIAAVLGNRKNAAAFQQAFWWDDDRSFRLYLKAAKGDIVLRDIKDPDTGELIERRAPAVVAAEHPPLPAAAGTRWRKARDRLLSLKQEIDAELKALEKVRQLCLDLSALRRQVAADESAIAALVARRHAAGTELTLCENQVKATSREHDKRAALVAQSRKAGPGLAARLFRTEGWKRWSQSHAPLVDAAALAISRRREAEQGARRAKTSFDAFTADLVKTDAQLSQLKGREARLAQTFDMHRPALGDRCVDAQLFAKSHETWNLTAPWLPDSLQRKREDLFIAALAVHRAFIDASARRVYHNLGALMEVFANGPPQDEAKRRLLGDLWSTLHLAVPVVSTTFASADRMLGALPAGSIGWLLIDEAGQAHPQAAVGAIMRARRIVVVGDPLQIQPVVTMPKRLTAEICKHFKVDPAIFAAPEASAQTVADRASWFQATFRAADGSRRVGIPLLVHRRCQEPMFGLFNRMAYDRQMVHAAVPRGDGAIGKALGPTRWFDLDGPADSKWCPAEGEAVVGLLKTIAASGVTKPDLFIVSPFRIVAQELRRRLEQETALFKTLDVDAHTWISERVGTIHTVQGREADAVMLVLGAPKPAQSRARIWAAETPNVFNVALSRARQSFYVIGSRDAWSGVGHSQELAALACEQVTLSPNVHQDETQPERSQNGPSPERRSPQHRRGPTL